MSSTVLERLQTWYESQCNEDWEHQHGVQIETLDNPGWAVKIDLVDTDLQGRAFVEVRDLDSESEWMACKVENERFLGYGGPRMLGRIVSTFLDWADGG
ncbi:MAG TPA: immunity 53 family protein [Polyangiaceae bacterium]|jgi:hypothetical protein|nr:immunity 53 family protein [Polyangiaceae bacterium]